MLQKTAERGAVSVFLIRCF